MITDFTKNVLATTYQDLVSTIRLNGTVVISTFLVNQVTNDTLMIEFDVPGELTKIEKLEVLKADGGILSQANLFVPLETDTRFRYQMKVGGSHG
ncbi:hypothetical protein J9303_00545 [Bacillaceae bacterium Marseille-Q3522]|nr:hypothetical protein [Bacillaceae bacterium Marseille-Q3522]